MTVTLIGTGKTLKVFLICSSLETKDIEHVLCIYCPFVLVLKSVCFNTIAHLLTGFLDVWGG
jgi:hypothetical protein